MPELLLVSSSRNDFPTGRVSHAVPVERSALKTWKPVNYGGVFFFFENTEMYLTQCLDCCIANMLDRVTYSKTGACTGLVYVSHYGGVWKDIRKERTQREDLRRKWVNVTLGLAFRGRCHPSSRRMKLHYHIDGCHTAEQLEIVN